MGNKVIGALQILSAEGGTFKDVLGELGNSSGLLDKNFEKISDTSAFKLSSAFNELKNSLIDIGGSLAPVIDGISKVISGLAKGIDALPGPVKNAIGYLSGFTAVLSPLALGLGKVLDGLVDFGGNFKLLFGYNPLEELLKNFQGNKKIAEETGEALANNFTNGIGRALEKTNISKLFNNSNLDKRMRIQTIEVDKSKVDQTSQDVINTIKKNFDKEDCKVKIHIDAEDNATDIIENVTDIVDALGDKGKDAEKLVDTMDNISDVTNKSTSAVSKFAGFLKSFTFGEIVLGMTAIAGAIYGVYKVVEAYNKKQREHRDAVEQATQSAEKYSQEIDELEGKKDKITSLYEEYEKLSKKSKKSAEEQERYNQILKEFAEIDPSLVEYDADGNPIALYTDDVKALIEYIELAIDKTHELLNTSKETIAKNSKEAYEEQKHENERKNENLGYKYDKWSTIRDEKGKEIGSTWQSADIQDDEWQKQLSQRNQELLQLYEEQRQIIEEDTKNKQKVSDDRKEYIKSELDNTKEIQDLSKKQKTAYKSFMDNMDFSDMDSHEIDSFTKTIQDKFSKMSDEQVKSFNKVMDKKAEFDRKLANDEISFGDYEAEMNKYISDVATLFDLTDEEARELIFGVEYDADKGNRVIGEIEKTKAYITNEIASLKNSSNEIRIGELVKIMADDKTPQAVKNAIAKALEDKEVTDQELNMIADVTAECNTEDAEKEINKKFDNLKKDIEGKDLNAKKKIYIEYAEKVKNADDLFQFVEEMSGTDVAVKITTAVSKGDFDSLKKDIENLPQEQQVAVLTALQYSGLMSPSELVAFIDTLPAEVQTAIKATSNYQELLKQKEELEKDTTSNHKTTSDNSDVATDKTNNQKQTNSIHEFIPNNIGVEQNKADNQKQTKSTHKFIPENSGVEASKMKNKQQTNSTHSIYANNSQVTSAKSANEKDTSSTHTITVKQVFKTIGQKISNLFGSYGGHPTKTSVNEPRIVKNIDVVANASLGSPRIASDLNNLANTTTTASQTISANMNNVVSAMAKTASNTIDTGLTRKALKYNVDLLTVLQAKIDKVTASLSKLNAKQELAFGNSKAKLLKEEISLLEQQQNLTSANIKNMQGMAKKLKSSLKNMGFKFADDGSITNYNKKIVAMEEKVAKLKSTAEKSEKTASKDKATKSQKSKATADQKAYEKAQAELDKMKQYTQEYIDLTTNQIPNAQAEWYELKNAIASANAEMITAKKEAKTLKEDLTIDVQTRYSDRRNSLASLDEAKADLTDDVSEKVKHLKNANKDYENELNRQQDLIDTYKSRMQDNRSVLKNYGFKFDDSGTTTNSASRLEKLKKSMSPEEYEAIYSIWDEYMNDLTSNLPNAQQEIVNLNQSIKDNKEEMEELQKQLKELNEEAQDLQLTSAYDKLNAQLDLVEAKMEGAFGKNKIKYLQEQIAITKDLRKQTQKLQEESKGDMNDATKSLSSYGIKFDENNNMTNLQSIVSKTDDIAKKEAILELANAYEEARQNVRDYQLEAVELENQQRELADAILEVQYELEQLADDAWARELENDLKIIQNELEIVQGLADLSGTNTFDNLEHQAELYKKLIQETQQDLIDYQNKANKYGSELSDYGFVIEDDGTIDNMDEQLLKLKDSLSDTEFSHVEDLLDQYFDYSLDKMNEAEKSLIDYQKAIEDIEREKLEATKDIEDKITEVIEKQVEDRIDEIEKEKEARIEALDEAQKAYDRWRAETKYEDDYNEQLSKVQELEAQIEIAKRDTSLAGQKRLQDLMQQLNDEQKNLEDLVEDKIDEDINNMFDDEKDRIEKTAEQEKNALEEMFSDVNIAEMVAQALESGIFTDIEGNVMSLDQALLDFANNSAEYLGVMGDTLKTELLSNLDTALRTVQELQGAMSTIDYNSVKYAGEGYASSSLQGSATANNVSINVDFGGIDVSGSNVDEAQIRRILDESASEITSQIEQSILKNMK